MQSVHMCVRQDAEMVIEYKNMEVVFGQKCQLVWIEGQFIQTVGCIQCEYGFLFSEETFKSPAFVVVISEVTQHHFQARGR